MLSAIADLYLTAQVFILLDNAYLSRFWTLMEAWCSMMALTKDGVRKAEDAERRYTIQCLHNADPEFDAPKLIKMLSTKSPEEVHDILAKPDINLSNQKDKQIMLPKVKETNERVKHLLHFVDLTMVVC